MQVVGDMLKVQDVVIAMRGERAWAHYAGRWHRLRRYHLQQWCDRVEMDPRGSAFRLFDPLPPRRFVADLDGWPHDAVTFESLSGELHQRNARCIVVALRDARMISR